ncbi:MAG TPA: hypothetical protein VNB64_08050 [Solirubrobacteraceae bacterium]|nr:hypothetical protein [Solirubrobacteraceae bacterium]
MEEPQDPKPEGGTTPQEGTQVATTPPGNGQADEDAVRQAEEKLDQAGGGH